MCRVPSGEEASTSARQVPSGNESPVWRAITARSVGIAQRAHDEALAYAQQRKALSRWRSYAAN
ncbi:hypothetical protein [Micromonospora luteifusca]|uniref:hypothetical protein n=1 Tax=Micromonospora luteifusca TaxID=709860 RepID=UPI0033B05575